MIRRDLLVLWLDIQILLSDVLSAILEWLLEHIEYQQVEQVEAECQVEFIEAVVTGSGVLIMSGGARHTARSVEFSRN